MSVEEKNKNKKTPNEELRTADITLTDWQEDVSAPVQEEVQCDEDLNTNTAYN